MTEEMNYLSERIEELDSRISKGLDYGYTGGEIDDQLSDLKLLANILNYITINELK